LKLAHHVKSIRCLICWQRERTATRSQLRSDEDRLLRIKLRGLPPRDLEALLRWLLADEGDRENIASQALKRREGGDALAEHITTLTTHPEQHERFMRVLGQIDGKGD
jgi:hypothetical protein